MKLKEKQAIYRKVDRLIGLGIKNKITDNITTEEFIEIGNWMNLQELVEEEIKKRGKGHGILFRDIKIIDELQELLEESKK